MKLSLPPFKDYPRFFRCQLFFSFLAASFLLISCTGVLAHDLNKITIKVDGSQKNIDLAPGKSVQDALDEAGIKCGTLDRIDPPTFTVVNHALTIQVIRVREEFQVEEAVIPFQQQTLKNESLPEKQTMIIQKGVNGKQQITYRHLFEDNVEVSKSITKTVVISEALPEIMMVGVQSPFTSISISGKLVFLSANNAWKMEGSSSNRNPVATSGDLDGRIFSVSPKGDYLLFTRKTSDDASAGNLNSLWVVDLNKSGAVPVNLKINNVIHFADWVPNKNLTIAYSTVEPRPSAPGWQANNDLEFVSMDDSGQPDGRSELIQPNSGGVYGWWGTSFNYSADGAGLAYSRPDGVGIVDQKTGKFTPFYNETPLQTRSDWAWVPGLTWAFDHSLLFTVSHAPNPGMSAETSPNFDLVSIIPGQEKRVVTLFPQTGMFAYPSASPQQSPNRFLLAYLQSITPDQSETSRYRLVVMDQDGSNRSVLFPEESSPGIEPQQVVWSPYIPAMNTSWIGVLYQGNLWFINPITKQAQQVTGDGTITRLSWSNQ